MWCLYDQGRDLMYEKEGKLPPPIRIPNGFKGAEGAGNAPLNVCSPGSKGNFPVSVRGNVPESREVFKKLDH